MKNIDDACRLEREVNGQEGTDKMGHAKTSEKLQTASKRSPSQSQFRRNIYGLSIEVVLWPKIKGEVDLHHGARDANRMGDREI